METAHTPTTHTHTAYTPQNYQDRHDDQMAEIRRRLDAFKAEVQAQNKTWRQGLAEAIGGFANTMATSRERRAADPFCIWEGNAPIILVTRMSEARGRRLASAARRRARRAK